MGEHLSQKRYVVVRTTTTQQKHRSLEEFTSYGMINGVCHLTREQKHVTWSVSFQGSNDVIPPPPLLFRASNGTFMDTVA
jgi:hypothetical protein